MFTVITWQPSRTTQSLSPVFGRKSFFHWSVRESAICDCGQMEHQSTSNRGVRAISSANKLRNGNSASFPTYSRLDHGANACDGAAAKAKRAVRNEHLDHRAPPKEKGGLNIADTVSGIKSHTAKLVAIRKFKDEKHGIS